MSDPALSLEVLGSEPAACRVRVTANAYAHAVHLALPADARPSDNYFDLLPGESRDVDIHSPQPLDPATIAARSVVR